MTGGAGGLIYISSWDLSGTTTYSITIGAGGVLEANGGNSTVTNGIKTLTSIGGGHGLNGSTDHGSEGGSGGGGWYKNPGTGYASNQPVSTNDGVHIYDTTGWGHRGGDGYQGSGYSGGGGGAHSPGLNGVQSKTGILTYDQQGAPLMSDRNNNLGGAGKYYADFNSYGDSGHFASGGTGGNNFAHSLFTPSTRAHRGGGGFGNNAIFTHNPAADGKPNTGGGAGSGGYGGSGIVLVRY